MNTLIGLAALALAAVALAPLKAGADTLVPTYETGNDLWRWCGETATGPAPGLCTAYVVGVVDGEVVERSALNDPQDICISTDAVVAGQVADVVRLFLAQHPADRNYPGAALAIIAVKVAFPCAASH
jgi:hypothetical protein